MDKKIKLLIHFLKFLSKKHQFKQITFDVFKKNAIDMGFKNFSNNAPLYKFYNQNVSPEVKWEDLDLSPFINDFYTKIKLISQGQATPNQLFSDPMDDHFRLGPSSRSDFVDFYEDSIHIAFRDQYSNFLLDLINLDESDLSHYHSAKYNGDCYEIEYSSDELSYMFNGMDSDNINKLEEIVTALGDMELAGEIKGKTRLPDDASAKIIRLFEKVFGDKYNDRLFDEYRNAARRASCQSIIKTYEEHFTEYVRMYNDDTIEIDYDFFLNFLENHPTIQSFADLKGYNLIEHHTDISEASYEFNLDYPDLNREYYYILDNMLDDIMEDEGTSKMVESVKEFENLMKKLKFQYQIGDRAYKRVFEREEMGDRIIFYISLDTIDFKNKKVVLLQLIDQGLGTPLSTKYKIPFDEIADYVTIKKLHESIKKLIRKYLLK